MSERTPDEALIRQHVIIATAIEKLTEILGNIRAPETGATWADVATHQHVIDTLRRADLALE
jgi:hypothetical protein